MIKEIRIFNSPIFELNRFEQELKRWTNELASQFNDLETTVSGLETEMSSVSQSWADTLGVDPESSGNNPTITSGDHIDWLNSGFTGVLDTLTLTGNVSWNFPNQSGTIALLSDIPSPTTPDWADVLGVDPESGGNNPLLTTTDQLQFRDSGLYINSSVDGQLDIVSDDILNLNVTTRVLSNADIRIDAASRYEWHLFTESYIEETNGTIWHFDVLNFPNLEVIWENTGIGDFAEFTIGATNVTIGTGFTGEDYTLTFDGENSDGILQWLEDEDRFNFQDNIQISTLGTGILHSDASGIITSSVIDISTDTNLAVTDPITLTGDNIGFNQAFNFTWTGTHEFDNTVIHDNDVTFRSSVSGNPTIFYDESAHSWTQTFNPNGTSGHFLLTGDITSKPSGNPYYFRTLLTRSWTDTNLTGTIMDVTVDDNRTLNGGIASLTTLFNFTYDMGGLTNTGTSAEHPVGMRVSFTGNPSYNQTHIPTMFGIGTDGTNASTWSPQFNTASSRSIDIGLLALGQICNPSNAGAGTLTLNYNALYLNTAFGIMDPGFNFGPDVFNLNYLWFKPTATLGITTAPISTMYGLRWEPTISTTGGTSTFYGIYWNPTLSGSGTNNSYIIWAERDNIVFDNDSSRILFGEDQDFAVGEYTGTVFHLARPLAATSQIVVNNDRLDTDFRIAGNPSGTDNLFYVDAGAARVAIGNNLPGARFGITGRANETQLRITANATQTTNTFLIRNNAGTTQNTIGPNGASVWNEAGNAVNQRMEGDTDINCFFLQGSTDRIGIGTATPAVKLDVNGTIHARSQNPIRYGDADNSNFVAFRSAATVTSNVTWTLPAADGTSGQVLSTNGSGTLSWISGAGHATSWISVTLDADSDPFSSNSNIFDEDNFTSFASTTHDSSGITYTSSTGRFTVPNTGTYKISLNLFFELENTNLINLQVRINGTTDIYNHTDISFADSEATSDCDDRFGEITIDLIESLTASDYLEFLFSGGTTICISSAASTAKDGTTVSIHQIA